MPLAKNRVDILPFTPFGIPWNIFWKECFVSYFFCSFLFLPIYEQILLVIYYFKPLRLYILTIFKIFGRGNHVLKNGSLSSRARELVRIRARLGRCKVRS